MVPNILAAYVKFLQVFVKGGRIFEVSYGLALCLFDLKSKPSSDGGINPQTSRISCKLG